MRAYLAGVTITAAWGGLAVLAEYAPHVAVIVFATVAWVCGLLTVALAVSSPLGRYRARRRRPLGLRPVPRPPRNPDRPAAAYESYTIPTGVRDRIGPWNVDSPPPQDPGLSEWR
jgi:hypothetical protein